MIREVKNGLGRRQDFGGCYCCGDTWNWKKSHDIKYSETSGMFPLCEECYKKLSPKEIKKYITALILEWKKQELMHNLNTYINQEKILKSAMVTVYKEKGE